MTNYLNSSLLNRYNGTKTSYFDGLLNDMVTGRKSASTVSNLLQGYQWEENGERHLGEVSKVTAQVYKAKDKESIGSQIIRDGFKYWKGKVYYSNGEYTVAILGIEMYDIIFDE